MKIYTKTGDKGETGLFGGERVKKTDIRIAALGVIDELNSSLGIAVCYVSGDTKYMLEEIQNELFTIGAELNSLSSNEISQELPEIKASQVERLETYIDFVTEKLPEQKTFLIPGGSKASAFLDNARAICRRCDRVFSALVEDLSPEIVSYVNRLADLLYVLSRKERNEEKAPKY